MNCSARTATFGRWLTPLWLGLWLLAPFLGSAWTWQNADGTLCRDCTFGPTERVVDTCCERGEASLFPADASCKQCCKAGAQDAPIFAFNTSSPVAIRVAPVEFAVPIALETPVFQLPEQQQLKPLPRPPPRGRAPPSPFELRPE